MVERRARVSEHMDRAARRALADRRDTEDSIAQLENVAVEAWHNLIGRDGFLPVLILLVAAMIAAPLLGGSTPGLVITVAINAAALLFTVFRSTNRDRARRLTIGYVAVATAAALAALAANASNRVNFDEHRLVIVVMVLTLGVQVVAFPLVLIRSFRHRRVTVNTVCATLSAYLLIGLIFTTVYRLWGQLAPPFFTQFEGGGAPTPGQYAYFSFITLTTVGYGDLTAASDPERAMVMVEAVLARVVGMLGFHRVGAADVFEPDPDDEVDRVTDDDDRGADRPSLEPEGPGLAHQLDPGRD